MTQREKILSYMKKFGSISALQAFSDLGCTQLGARIFELKKQGYMIGCDFVKGKNRFGEEISYKKYYIVEATE